MPSGMNNPMDKMMTPSTNQFSQLPLSFNYSNPSSGKLDMPNINPGNLPLQSHRSETAMPQNDQQNQMQQQLMMMQLLMSQQQQPNPQFGAGFLGATQLLAQASSQPQITPQMQVNQS